MDVLKDCLGLIRSALFVPGNQPERIDKALGTNADAVIIDLEDAVPAAEKSKARQTTVDKLRSSARRKVFVRINGIGTPYFLEDLDAVTTPGLIGLMVPKIEGRQPLLELNEILSNIEKHKDLPTIPIIGTIETASGVVEIHRITQTVTTPRRLYTLVFGAADFTSEMGVAITRDAQALHYPRARIAVACCAAGLTPPLDTPYMIDIKNLKALETDAIKAKKLGFGGKICIHPNQVEIVNRVFSPSPDEISKAETVVRAFDDAESKGLGAIQIDGKFIDKPIVERSRKILILAKSYGCTY